MSVPQGNETYHDILDTLRRYDTHTAFWLILSVLASWGFEFVEMGLKSDARAVAETFWGYLKLPSEETPPSPRTQDGDAEPLDHEEIGQEANKWAVQLAQLPFEETIRSFTSAVDEWLQTCDLARFKDPGESDVDTMIKMQRIWGYNIV